MYHIIHDNGLDNQLDCNVSNLTELDLSEYIFDLKQLMVACPQLQRLNLGNKNLRLEDLEVIATCCPDLQGLNLEGLLIPDNKFCVKVWEILSTMKLIYLTVDDMLFFEIDKSTKDEKSQLVTLFKQVTTLRALELISSYSYVYCNELLTLETLRIFSGCIYADCYGILSNFPSLEYLRVYSQQYTCVQDILTICKKLKYFR